MMFIFPTTITIITITTTITTKHNPNCSSAIDFFFSAPNLAEINLFISFISAFLRRKIQLRKQNSSGTRKLKVLNEKNKMQSEHNHIHIHNQNHPHHHHHRYLSNQNDSKLIASEIIFKQNSTKNSNNLIQ